MVKIIEQVKNPLINREEIVIVENLEATPSNQDAVELISQEFNKKQELIVIKNILNKFGDNEFKIIAYIYDSVEDKEKTEPKSKKKSGEQTPKQSSDKAEEKKEPSKEELKESNEPKESGEAKQKGEAGDNKDKSDEKIK